MNALSKNVDITEVGINGLGDLTENQFFKVGERLSSIDKGLQWAIGDWYNAIPWGDKAAACERAGLNYDTARTYGVVASAFKIDTRVSILAFKHHQMLTHSDLTKTDRKRLLKKAEVEGMSSAKLKHERDIILGLAAPAPTRVYDASVDALEASVTASLPEGTGKKTINSVVKGLKKEAAKLKHEFTAAVEQRAEEKSKVQRENMKTAQHRADEQYEKAVHMAAGVKAFMTKKEFLLVRACLHPDKNPNPKANEAFTIFNRLADVKDW